MSVRWPVLQEVHKSAILLKPSAQFRQALCFAPQLNAFHYNRKGNQDPFIPWHSSLDTRTVNKSAAFRQLEDSRDFRNTLTEGSNTEPSAKKKYSLLRLQHFHCSLA
jgi:hypothetical protein